MSAATQIDWGKYASAGSAPSAEGTPASIDFSKYEGKPEKVPDTVPEKPTAWDSAKEFGSALWKQLNPVSAVKGAAQIAAHPIETLKNDAESRQKVYADAESAFGRGDYEEGAAHLLYSAIPFLGPQMNEAAKDILKGEYAKGVGSSVGQGLALAGPQAISEAGVIPKTVELVRTTPEIVSGGWRKIGNPMGLASTGEELLTQGISPRTSLSNWKPSVKRAAGDLKAFDAQSPIKSVQDLHDAIPEIKQKIWSEEIEPELQKHGSKPVDMQPVADKVRAQISDEMKTFDEANADKLETLASKLESARDVTSANKLLKYINGNLESYFQKFPAARKANLMNNPETAGWEAARSELRNQFLGTLEDAGAAGVRDARLRYGAFDTLQDAVERRVNVADRAKPMSLGRIAGLAGATAGVAAAPFTGGASLGGAALAEFAGELSHYLNKPDVLVRRGIRNLPETSIRTTPFSESGAISQVAETPTSPVTGGKLASPAELFKSGIRNPIASAGELEKSSAAMKKAWEIERGKPFASDAELQAYAKMKKQRTEQDISGITKIMGRKS